MKKIIIYFILYLFIGNGYMVYSQDIEFNLSQNYPSLVGPNHTLGSGGSILKLPNGKILHYFRLDPGLGGNHVGNSGAIAQRFSIDNGGTWSEPVVIFDDEYDDRFATSYRLDNGDIIVFFFRYFAYDTWNGVFVDAGMVFSKDEGATWSERIYINNISPTSCFQNLFKIPGKTGYFASTYSTSYVDIRYSPDGYNWDSVYYKWDYRGNPTTTINEPFFCSLGDGRIMGLFRVENQAIHQTVSSDYGVTWSTLEPTNLGMGYFCPAPTIYYDSLFNKIVTIFADRRGSSYDFNNYFSGIWVYFSDPDSVFSNPQGYTNYNFIVRAMPTEFRILGYSSTTKVDDNTYLVVYSESQKKYNDLEDADYYQFYVTIEKHPQFMDFPPLPPRFTYNDNPIKPHISVTSNLPIQLESSDTTIVTIINDSLYFVGTGFCDITAKQVGNYWFDTVEVKRRIEVHKANQMIDMRDFENFIYGQDSLHIPYFTSANLPLKFIISDTSVVKLINNTLQIVGTGMCEISATNFGTNNYNPVYKTQILTIQKAQQNFIFAVSDHMTYGGEKTGVDTITNVGLSVIYESSDTSVLQIIQDSIIIVGTGMCEIRAYQVGNQYYYPVFKSRMIHVDKANQDFDFILHDTLAYGEKQDIIHQTTTADLPVFYNSLDTSIIKIVDSTLIPLTVGECDIVAYNPGNNLYNPVYKTKRFTVNRALQIVQLPVLDTLTVGIRTIELPTISEYDLPIEYISLDTSIVQIVNGHIHVVGPGICDIRIIHHGNGLYEPIETLQTIEINKGNQDISLDTFDVLHFNQPKLHLVRNTNADLPIRYISSDTTIVRIVEGELQVVGVGECDIIAIQDGTNMYNPYTTTRHIVTDKAQQTIELEPFNQYISATIIAPRVHISSGLPVVLTSSDTTVAKIIDGLIYIVNAGTCIIYAEQVGDSLYYGTEKVYQELQVVSTEFNKVTNTQYRVYPNPTSGLLTITNAKESTIQVISSTGAIVSDVFTTNTIDVSYLKNGQYFVKISNGSSQTIIPFILTK